MSFGIHLKEKFKTILSRANEIIKRVNKAKSSEVEEAEVSEVEELLGSSSDSLAIEENPILDLVKGVGYPNGPIIYSFNSKDIPKINEYLSYTEVQQELGQQFRYAKLIWGIPQLSDDGEEIVDLYAIRGNIEDTPKLSGSVITDARQSYSVDGITPTVSMQMNTKGAKYGNREGIDLKLLLLEIIQFIPLPSNQWHNFRGKQ